jgi:acetoin utilization deacetylase AcuC-like enzyme
MDEEYLGLVRNILFPTVMAFQPEILFWNWGYDGTQGDYGDIGLTPDFHILLTRELKGLANEICQGRLIVVLCGGSRRDLARILIPEIIKIISGE